MKFGEKLKANKDPAFAAHYLDYEGLKRIIRALADNETTSLDVIPSKISLSVAQGGRIKKQLHKDVPLKVGQPSIPLEDKAHRIVYTFAFFM